jgi:hypothetical protein
MSVQVYRFSIQTALPCILYVSLLHRTPLYSRPPLLFTSSVRCNSLLTASAGISYPSVTTLSTTFLSQNRYRIYHLRFSRRWLWRWLVFLVVAPCRLVWVYRRFGGLYCLHHQDRLDDGGTCCYNPDDSHLNISPSCDSQFANRP